MSDIEHYQQELQNIEQEIVRRGIMLNIDWQDTNSVQRLAHEALHFHTAGEPLNLDNDLAQRSKLELFALAQLMLTVMRECAENNNTAHGGKIWKIFGAALWRASGMPDTRSHGNV